MTASHRPSTLARGLATASYTTIRDTTTHVMRDSFDNPIVIPPRREERPGR